MRDIMKKEKKFNYVKHIEKELNKRSDLCIKHFPTEDEKVCLSDKNITYKSVIRKIPGLVTGWLYDEEYCLYTKVQ